MKLFKNWFNVLLIAAIVVLAYGLLRKSSTPDTLASNVNPNVFDLEVRLHGPNGIQDFVKEGQVNLRLGFDYPQEPRPLDANGSVVFKAIDKAKYKDKAIQILFFPPQGRPYKLGPPSASTTTGENQVVSYQVDFMN
jgi:hypothetical protein